VWCYGAQSYRPFGTAAEYVTVPSGQAVPLPGGASFEQGAGLGIPGITAHRCVHVGGPVAGRVVLVQGGAGAVGSCAVQLARQAGARVIATVRSGEDEAVASRAGAHEVIQTGGVPADEVVGRIRTFAPEGVAHIVEVAFGANIAADTELLAVGGSLAAYATGEPSPAVPFWPLVFKNIRLFFLGSDDFPAEAKAAAARDLNAALDAGWPGFEIGGRFPLSAVAEAHEYLEGRRGSGRVVVVIEG
jgi:NADPH2:quinone reductase